MTAHAGSAFRSRLLGEIVRLQEEAAGHPPHTPQADEAAIRAGGDFGQRLRERARQLPVAAEFDRAWRRARRGGTLIASGLILIPMLAGAAAGTAILDPAVPVSLPLALLALIGLNLASLLMWLLLQLGARRVAPGLGRGVQRLMDRWMRTSPAGAAGAPDGTRAMLQVLGGTAGRWLFGAAVHLAWLSFSLAALLALTVLLSTRAHTLVWETTLLSPDALQRWARALSVGPALLGVDGPETLPLEGADRAWAGWLLAAVLVYGVLPRLIALGACLALAWYRCSTLGRELSLPGYARLRARLMPDHRALGVIDPAPVAPDSRPPAPSVPPPTAGADGLRAFGLEYAVAPERLGSACRWLGLADDADSRRHVLAAAHEAAGVPLAILVRASATPDRGAEHFAVDVVRAAQAPVVLVLAQARQLEARGAAFSAQRLDDWRGFAARIGAGRVVRWNPDDALLSDSLARSEP